MTINHADWDLLYDCNICRRCGEWLPLGPSNDSGCEVEIRAAALVASFDDCLEEFTVREYHGWNKAAQPCEHDAVDVDEEPGYLAFCIDDHKDEP